MAGVCCRVQLKPDYTEGHKIALTNGKIWNKIKYLLNEMKWNKYHSYATLMLVGTTTTAKP